MLDDVAGGAGHARRLAVRGGRVFDEKRRLAGGCGKALRERGSKQQDQYQLDHGAVMRPDWLRKAKRYSAAIGG